MRFGERLRKERIPEWKTYYMEYNYLKQIIKAATNDPWGSNKHEQFLESLVADVLKVSRFFELTNRKIWSEIRKESMVSERVQDLLRQNYQLLNFATLNGEGFRKIVKKYDKNVGTRILPAFQENIQQWNFHNTDVWNQMQGVSPEKKSENPFTQLKGETRDGEELKAILRKQILKSLPTKRSQFLKHLETFKEMIRERICISLIVIIIILSCVLIYHLHNPDPFTKTDKIVSISKSEKDLELWLDEVALGQTDLSTVCPQSYDAVHLNYTDTSATVTCETTTGLTGDSYITIAVVLLAAIAMIRRNPPDICTISATLVLTLLNVITPTEAWAGFSNNVVLSVGALGVVAEGLKRTRVIEMVFERYILGSPSNVVVANLRLCFSAVIFSAFINNTLVVGVLMTVVDRWAEKIKLDRQIFLINVSFAAILGGVCTIIGTSSNLITQSLLVSYNPTLQFDIFGPAKICAPVALFGLVYISLVSPLMFHKSFKSMTCTEKIRSCLCCGTRKGHKPDNQLEFRLLHDRSRPLLFSDIGGVDTKLYNVMFVLRGRDWIGKTLEAAFVQKIFPNSVEMLCSLTNIDILGQSVIPTCNHVISTSDILEFTTDKKTIARMLKAPGLEVIKANTQEVYYKSNKQHLARSEMSSDAEECQEEQHRILVECVLGEHSPLGGQRLSEVRVWESLNAVLVSVADQHQGRVKLPKSMRRDHKDQLAKRHHEHVLRWGDVVLMVVTGEFLTKNQEEFLYCSVVEEYGKPWEELPSDTAHALMSGCILIGMILTVVLKLYALFEASMSAVVLLIFTGCLKTEQAFAAIKIRTLLTIIGTFGMGKAFEKTGVALMIANGLVSMASPGGEIGILATVYLVACMLGSFFHSTATVVLMFTICTGISTSQDINIHKILIVMMEGAASQFLTPISYQTNLMVYTDGEYDFTDFTKLGIGLCITSGIIIIAMTELALENEGET